MAEKKTVSTKKNVKETKEGQETPVKKTTSKKTTSKTTKSVPKTTTTTTSKTRSTSSAKKSPAKTVTKKTATTKKTPSKTTKATTKNSPKESTTTQTKKSVNSKSTAKKVTNKKKASTPKKKETASKTKNNSTVKIKDGTSKTKKTTTNTKKKPIKKITSTKKVLGKHVSIHKKEVQIKNFKENIKKLTSKIKLTSVSLFRQLKVNSKKVGNFLKNSGSKITSKAKEFSKTTDLNLKKGLQNVKSFLQSKKKRPKKLVKKQEKVKIIKKAESLEQTEKKKKLIIPSSKKTRRIFIILAIFCLVLAVLLMVPYGVSTYISGASNKTLDVPKFMKPKEECCNYSITFSSPRSVWSLKKDMEKIISSYEPLNCDGKNYYYNEQENYTITEYGVKRGIFLNQVYFTYGTGNSCDIDTRFKKLELLDDDFSIEDAKKDGNYVMEGDKVYNKDTYDEFMSNVNAKIPSTLRIVTTNEEGDVLITDLEYLNSGKYLVSYDATRDRNNKNPHSIIAYKFDHLKLSKNKLYAYNGDKLVIKKAKKYETFYLLTLPNE